MQDCYTDAPSIVELGRCYNFLRPSRKGNAVSELLTPERIGLRRGAVAEFLCLPLPPAPTRQLLNEVALEVPEHLGYLTLFWSEEALPPDIARDHIREIGARLAEIAMLMPRVKTARAERVAADALDAASAPAPTQPENRLGLSRVGPCEAADAGRWFSGLCVADRTEFALTIARLLLYFVTRRPDDRYRAPARRPSRPSIQVAKDRLRRSFRLGVPAAATDVGFAHETSAAPG
jgi:hypothetical protein